MICPDCNQPLQIGDWPYCPHGSTRPEWAQRFDPIVIHRSADGKYRFPMAADAPVPEGYQKVELTTRRQVEAIEREVNQRERIQFQEHAHRQREASNEFWRRQNAELRERAKSFSPEGQAAVEYLLEKQAREDRGLPNYDPGFHVEIMHNYSSNREGHDDARTGWKTIRK